MVDYTFYLQQAVSLAKAHGVQIRFVSRMPKHVRPTPVRGAFRMGEVLLPRDNPEEALFVLLHGLGHMAQWTLFPSEHEQSYFFNGKDNAWGERQLKQIWDHEWNALPYTLGFLREHNLEILTDWYVRYFTADQYYLATIFRENSYSLRKFYRVLERVRGRRVQKRVQNLPFPDLSLATQRSDYICVI